MDADLPENSHLHGDKAYPNACAGELVRGFQQAKLKAATKKNSLKMDT
jgi:hypothetical protein